MRYSLRAPSFLIAVVVVFTLAPTISVHPTIGQEVTPGREVTPTSPERLAGAQRATATFNKLLAKLNEPTKLDFFETPLEEVVQEISDRHDVRIRLEKSALEDLKIDASELVVTFEIDNVKLGTALSLLLDDIGLVLSARDNVFLFTTEEADREIVRVYDTSGLVHADDNCEGLIETMKSVEPGSWAENGGDGMVVVYQRNLVVSQSLRVHIDIVALLNELRDNIAKAGGPQLPKAVPAGFRPAASSDRRRRGQRDGGGDFGSLGNGGEAFIQRLSVGATASPLSQRR